MRENVRMGSQRDPVSVWFDDAARQLLERAYRNQGQWTGQYLAPPSARALAVLAVMGVNPMARDRWGEVRWVRAYKRACYNQLKKYGTRDRMNYAELRTSPWPARSLEWQTGARIIKAGWPQRRWAIRVRIHPTGAAASRAARENIANSQRWVVNGRVTDRQSTPANRGY
jgi:hypothetical protein